MKEHHFFADDLSLHIKLHENGLCEGIIKTHHFQKLDCAFSGIYELGKDGLPDISFVVDGAEDNEALIHITAFSGSMIQCQVYMGLNLSYFHIFENDQDHEQYLVKGDLKLVEVNRPKIQDRLERIQNWQRSSQ